MARVVVLGAYGMLGSSLCPFLADAGHTVFRQGRNTNAELRIDLFDTLALESLISNCRPEVIINLAAATNVDRCEEDVQGAFLANVRTVESVVQAILARREGCAVHLIQISSDHVYDGPGPHPEADARPCNAYALTKYAGELAATRAGATVLRTNFFGRSHCVGRTSLSDWLVDSLRSRRRITVFDDVLFNALHVTTLCRLIELTFLRRMPGVFNVGCRDGCSKAEFAFRLANLLGLDQGLMTLGNLRDVALRGRRPLDMRMDVTHFEHTFGIDAPAFDEQIRLTTEEYYLA